jgi:hypothetical protein
MGKAIGLLIGVLAIWVAVEIYTQGPDNAFGGRFATVIGSGDGVAKRGSTAERVGAAVGRAREQERERYDQLMPE